MTKYNTIPNDDEALLAQKHGSLKGLLAGAAVVSFALGLIAATAFTPAVSTEPTLAMHATKTSSGEYWWQDGSTTS